MKQQEKERNALVVQSNDIVRATRAEMTAQEQKLLIYIISKVQPDDPEFYRLKISFNDYCDLMNIERRGAKAAIKKSIKSLADKSWWINTDPNYDEILFRWLDRPAIKGSYVEVKLSDELKPYLIGLRERFTKYNLINVLALDSKYSIRLYEILKSHLWEKEYHESIENLHLLLGAKDKYPNFKDFNKFILKRSIEEINTYTDLKVEYEVEKRNKSAVGVWFFISGDESKSVEERVKTVLEWKKRFDK